jgi:hypothetical protein
MTYLTICSAEQRGFPVQTPLLVGMGIIELQSQSFSIWISLVHFLVAVNNSSDVSSIQDVPFTLPTNETNPP